MPTQAEYTGVQIIPGVFVKDTKGNQVDPSEYTITYGENVEIGTGTVTITMNGKNYVGTFTKTFKIVDKNTDNKKDDNSDNSGNSGENGGNTSGSTTDSSNSSSSNNSANASSDNNKESTKNTENAVKTGDSSKDVAQLGAMSVISLLFMSLLKRKEDKNKVSE